MENRHCPKVMEELVAGMLHQHLTMLRWETSPALDDIYFTETNSSMSMMGNANKSLASHGIHNTSNSNGSAVNVDR